jgi:hypothetical protein
MLLFRCAAEHLVRSSVVLVTSCCLLMLLWRKVTKCERSLTVTLLQSRHMAYMTSLSVQSTELHASHAHHGHKLQSEFRHVI